MNKEFNTADEFYDKAMAGITQAIGSKLRVLGVNPTDIPYLISEGRLNRYTSDEVDGVILEMYEYDVIRLAEFEWSTNGIKQRDINKDERDIREHQQGI